MPLILPGQEVSLNEPGRTFQRHHHLQGYAAVLISGTCYEAGDRGRFETTAGDVLFHAAFDGHADRIGSRGAVFLNIPLSQPIKEPYGRVRDLDLLIRTFERDPRGCAECLDDQFVSISCPPKDWPDLLAQTLAADPSVRIETWALSNGLHPASVSRGFRLAYGVSPKRFRHEQRAAHAARRIAGIADSLAAVAADCGFADQAHMTRTFVQLFGTSPAKLRRRS